MVVAGGPPVTEGWHGGQVFSRTDGALLGLLLTPQDGAPPRIARVPAGAAGR